MAVDWTASMTQAPELWYVDPASWDDEGPVRDVESCSCEWDDGSETGCGVTATVHEETKNPPFVMRAYVAWEQGDEAGRECIGTWLVTKRRPSSSDVSGGWELSGYGPLEQARRGKPPVGWAAPAGALAGALARQCLERNCQAPVLVSPSNVTLAAAWVADMQASWLDCARAVAGAAGMSVRSDAWGRSVVGPDPTAGASAPVWRFDTGNASIVEPGLDGDDDAEDAPNVVEVVASSGGALVVGRASNDDPGDPLSTASRGYEVVERIENPDGLLGGCSQELADRLARATLRELSAVTREVTITHGLCPARCGDAVELSMPAFGVECMGRIVAQTMDLATGTEVRSTIECWRA